MRISSLIALILAATVALAGCGHKLVTTEGEETVKVYPDEKAYERLTELQKQGGPLGSVIGDVGKNLIAKEVANDTRVNIISRDDRGALIEVTKGPDAGLKGFVRKENLD
jgi:ABC-type oligopeptide transport system substrate-binding subunit